MPELRNTWTNLLPTFNITILSSITANSSLLSKLLAGESYLLFYFSEGNALASVQTCTVPGLSIFQSSLLYRYIDLSGLFPSYSINY